MSCFLKRLSISNSISVADLLLTGCKLFPKEESLLAPPVMEPVKVSYSTVKAKRGDIVKPSGVQAALSPSTASICSLRPGAAG